MSVEKRNIVSPGFPARGFQYKAFRERNLETESRTNLILPRSESLAVPPKLHLTLQKFKYE